MHVVSKPLIFQMDFHCKDQLYDMSTSVSAAPHEGETSEAAALNQ